MKTLRAVDLFAGCGGYSTGLAQACQETGVRLELTAVDLWDVALKTHALNHPSARHVCADLTALDPRAACPGGIDLMLASPPCQSHSSARGGKARDADSMCLAEDVTRWIAALRPMVVIVENVPRFTAWGPLDDEGKSIEDREGEYFERWLDSLRALGYRVQHRVLCAADFGEATTRRRVFVVAVMDGVAWRWPEPTHAKEPGEGDLFGAALPRWRGAREIIDWSLKGTSIFGRKKPLSDKTLARIEAGLRKFGGSAPTVSRSNPNANGTNTRHDGEPLAVVTSAGDIGVAEPFTVMTNNANPASACAAPADQPLMTLRTTARAGLAEPFIVAQHRNVDVPTAAPCPTITHDGAHRLIQPVRPVPEPFVLSAGGPEVGASPTSGPYPSVLTRDHIGLVEPFVLNQDARGANRPVSDPVLTSSSVGATALIAQYYGTSIQPDTVAAPRGAATVKDRFALLLPEGADVLFRMLQPHELAAAQGFPADYAWSGTKTERVKMIGNSVCVRMSLALNREAVAALLPLLRQCRTEAVITGTGGGRPNAGVIDCPCCRVEDAP